jgi:hypothetical protein
MMHTGNVEEIYFESMLLSLCDAVGEDIFARNLEPSVNEA